MFNKLRRSLVLPLAVTLSFASGMALTEWSHPQSVNAQNSAVKTLSQLNEDFIEISERVTPAVVSIAMTKRVKSSQTPRRLDPQGTPEEFFDFFGMPFPQGQTPGQPQPESRQQGVGSGVIVDAEKGYVLTNNHVVEDADEIKVTLTDRRVFKARVLGTDPRSDLAVIQLLNAKNLKQATIGDSSGLDVGEWVLAIGNPFGLDSTVTAGIISAKGRANVGVADFEDFIQTDAAINPGNSGGALVNIKGELVGINTAIATRSRGYMGIGFAIPSNMAKQVMDSLISKGKVSRAQLGVYIQELDASMAQSLKLESANAGILVSGVVPGSPAEKAGLKKYDVITQLNNKNVSDTNQFRNQIALTDPTAQVTLSIMRNGKLITLKPTLSEAEMASSATGNAPAIQAPQDDLVVQELTPALRQRYQIPSNLQGVLVAQLNANGQAAEKGIRRGDLITEINRQPVKSAAAFQTVYDQVKKGEVVLLALRRGSGSLVVAYEKP